MKLILLINVKMQTSILTFNSMINTTSASLKSRKVIFSALLVEVEISCSAELSLNFFFITSEPVLCKCSTYTHKISFLHGLTNLIFCSVRKQGKYSGKSQPWPPFRQRGKIMDCYKTMYRVLHCKTMHAFLFTILHRVCTRTLVKSA